MCNVYHISIAKMIKLANIFNKLSLKVQRTCEILRNASILWKSVGNPSHEPSSYIVLLGLILYVCVACVLHYWCGRSRYSVSKATMRACSRVWAVLKSDIMVWISILCSLFTLSMLFLWSDPSASPAAFRSSRKLQVTYKYINITQLFSAVCS